MDGAISLAQGKESDMRSIGKDQGPLLSTAVCSYISSAAHETVLQV